MKSISILVIALSLVRCATDESNGVATLELTRGQFIIEISGQGELRAEQATPINAPTSIRGALNITWLAEEGLMVHEGDVLVRFDNQDILTREDKAKGEIRRLDYEIEKSKRSNESDGLDMDVQLQLTQMERTQAETFAPKDERLYSREEIIDSQVNLEFLDTKIEHYEVKKGRHVKKSETDQQLLDLKQQTHKIELKQLASSGQELEVRAPHDGFFYIRDRGQRGKPRVGMMVWMGQNLGELPDLSAMEARVHVLEVEAAGLDVGLSALVELDGQPGVFHKAEVKKVDALAKSIERNNPIKYFEVILSVETTIPEIMKPGSHVEARITVTQLDDVIAVPNQVIFHEKQKPFVYVEQGGSFEKRWVVLGERSVTQTVIVEGLQEGERVALSEPEEGQDI